MADVHIPCCRLRGTHTFAEARQLVMEAIADACEAGQPALLVSLREIEGFAPPSLVERHRLVRDLADAAQGRVRIAMVVRPEFIDGEKFGVVAGNNFGLQSDVFTDEGEAAEWLRLHG
jgi:hypothetical protein